MFMLREVQAGMAFLDGKMPGWRKRINLDRLDLSSDFGCVVGQLFVGGFGAGAFIFGFSWINAVQYGFVLPDHLELHGDQKREKYAMLTETWKHEIRRTVAEHADDEQKAREQRLATIRWAMRTPVPSTREVYTHIFTPRTIAGLTGDVRLDSHALDVITVDEALDTDVHHAEAVRVLETERELVLA